MEHLYVLIYKLAARKVLDANDWFVLALATVSLAVVVYALAAL